MGTLSQGAGPMSSSAIGSAGCVLVARGGDGELSAQQDTDEDGAWLHDAIRMSHQRGAKSQIFAHLGLQVLRTQAYRRASQGSR